MRERVWRAEVHGSGGAMQAGNVQEWGWVNNELSACKCARRKGNMQNFREMPNSEWDGAVRVPFEQIHWSMVPAGGWHKMLGSAVPT